MIIPKDDQKLQKIPNMKGGVGTFFVRHIVQAEKLFGAGRMFAHCKLASGDSVGSHVHEEDIEICYFLNGTGRVIDDGQEYVVEPGACNVVPIGHRHEIINDGPRDLEYIVLILYKHD